MAFEDIAGQDPVVKRLRVATEKDHLPSGLIFYGIDGVGKKKTAYELARSLNCLGADPSCSCDSCVKIAHESHPDVLFIEPDGQYIKVDQVEPLIEHAMLRPFEGKKRIYIIDRAECIREETASRFLKTLEEPPLFAHFILLTAGLPSVLPTIRSRCGLFHFSELTPLMVEKLLVDRFDFGSDEARRRAALSGGSLGRSLSLEEQDFAYYAETSAWLDRSLLMGEMTPGELVAMILKEGTKTKIDLPDLQSRIDLMMEMVHDGMMGTRKLPGHFSGITSGTMVFSGPTIPSGPNRPYYPASGTEYAKLPAPTA